MTSVQTSTVWLDAALQRVETLGKVAAKQINGDPFSDKDRCEALQARYEVVCQRLLLTTAYFTRQADAYERAWTLYSFSAIGLAALLSVVNIAAATEVSPAPIKPWLATLAAVLSVGIGASATLASTRRWKDRPGSVAEARDQFFRLTVFVETLWAVISPARSCSREAYCAGSAVLLFAVEEESSLRTLFNEEKRQPAEAPANNKSEKAPAL